MVENKVEESAEKHYYSDLHYVAIGKPFLHDVCYGGFYSNQDLYTFIILKIIGRGMGVPNLSQKVKTIVTVDIILSMMGLSSGSRNKKLVEESLDKLYKGGMITSYTSFSFSEKVEELDTKSVMYLLLEETIIGEDKWFKVYDEDFNKIVNSGERNASKLIHVYSVIASDIYEKGKRKSLITNANIIESTSIDKKTVTKYIKLLEDIKVISRKTITITSDSGKSNQKNIITRYGFRNALYLADNESLIDD